MLRLKRNIICTILVALMLSSSALAVESKTPLGLEELTNRFLEENIEIKKLDLDNRLLKLRYEETLEDYEDLQKQVERAGKYTDSVVKQRKQARDEYYSASKGSNEEQAAFQYYHGMMHTVEAATDNYKALLKQEASMMKNLEMMVLEDQQADIKKQNDIELLKYQLQKDYYQLLILKEQRDLLEKSIANIDMQLNVEKTKKELDLTTELAVNNLETQKINLELSIEKLDNSIEQAIEKLKTDLNIEVSDNIDILFELPGAVSIKKYKLENVLKGFMEQSLDLKKVERLTEVNAEIVEKLQIAYEEDDTEYLISVYEADEAELNEKQTKRDFEHLVKSLYFRHNQLGSDLVQQLRNKLLADEKMLQLEVQYKTGVISKLQYNLQKQEIDQAIFDYKKAMIDYINTDTELQLAEKGNLATASW
ncbi:TolC family protein [Alkaliphilus pronyensis]|uniref:TolC family protein n=1 Tax=Alkaliphilus pronyensis TaxID=1482732 RepID=A0A6I0FAM3_9FIRM|nr:TolC family protein [Alkaliphilus pronyensis]KAB3534725.1 TolC family protein [Alkaliphilus pronyensis]